MLDMETSLTGRAGTRAGLASGQTNRPDRRGAPRSYFTSSAMRSTPASGCG